MYTALLHSILFYIAKCYSRICFGKTHLHQASEIWVGRCCISNMSCSRQTCTKSFNVTIHCDYLAPHQHLSLTLAVLPGEFLWTYLLSLPMTKRPLLVVALHQRVSITLLLHDKRLIIIIPHYFLHTFPSSLTLSSFSMFSKVISSSECCFLFKLDQHSFVDT